MATITVGTVATTSLTAIAWNPQASVADLATIRNLILQFNVNTNPKVPSAFENGILTLPDGRGQIQLEPGDYIAVDSTTGWPIVIPAAVMAASTKYTHS